jgi:hypothetical protein
MRLNNTFDLVLEVVAFAWQELRDFIDTARTTGTERPRCITYRLADLEFVISHSILHRQVVSIAMKITTEVRVRSLVAQIRDGLIDAAFASRYRFLLSTSELLPNAGGGVADFFNKTL